MSATNRGAVRNPQDAYYTPQWCVKLLLKELNINPEMIFLEPCKGGGNIYDLVDTKIKLWAELDEGVDFLSYTPPQPPTLIITNPPFSLALEFLLKSLLHKEATVIFLLRLNFLGSQKRKPFWNKFPPSHLYVLSERPSFTGHGTDATEYAWFVWDRQNICLKPAGVYVI